MLCHTFHKHTQFQQKEVGTMKEIEIVAICIRREKKGEVN